MEADKGYDAEELRLDILRMKLFPYIPYRRMGAAKSESRTKVLEKYRWKVERGISWLQRKYRRLTVVLTRLLAVTGWLSRAIAVRKMCPKKNGTPGLELVEHEAMRARIDSESQAWAKEVWKIIKNKIGSEFRAIPKELLEITKYEIFLEPQAMAEQVLRAFEEYKKRNSQSGS